MISKYAASIGCCEADARTARNIQLSVADCKHLVNALKMLPQGDTEPQQWTLQLIEYLRTAV